jgi:energy-coupling factor transporter ATP-binding protein EcfA2
MLNTFVSTIVQTNEVPSNTTVVPKILFVILLVWIIWQIALIAHREGLWTIPTKHTGKTPKVDYKPIQKPVQQTIEPELPTTQMLPMNQWLPIVNDDSNTYPSLWLVGKTGSGKTELLRAILSQREGKVLIIDIKDKPGKWGFPAISLDDNLEYTLIDNALVSVLEELKSRQKAMNTGTNTFEPLTIVLEELTTMAMFSTKVSEVFKKVSVIGREFNMRLIAVSQSDRVKSLGIEGLGDIREQFLYLALGNKARELVPNVTGKYPCVAKLDTGLTQFDTTNVPAYASNGLSEEKCWVVQTDDSQNTEDNTSTNAMTTPKSASIDTNISTDIPDTNGEYSDTDLTDDDTMIRALLARGLSANKIYNVLGGNRNQVMAKVKEIKGE